MNCPPVDLCSECVEIPGDPDWNGFCSSQCLYAWQDRQDAFAALEREQEWAS